MSTSSTLEDLIPVVNKLQDLVFNTIGVDTLDLPQVVVVGSQSSGKSSVLENIVGKDFLPRGTGIVTRRPLILQLVNISEEREWGEFLHIPDQKFYDFNDIRREIERETQRIAGANKGIHNLPINLKVYSPHVLNLTLVDLPGVTKVPIGDQPADIEKQTKELVLEYISKPNSLVLAVSPANQDLVNSESLKMARAVDPHGDRTIGVLTKLDLMDKGTNAIDILNGSTYSLKLGFIGVVNRSQQDIQERKSLDDALAAEKAYFQQHPAYRSLAHKMGTAYLAKTLNQILMVHIRERLPDIKARLNTLIGQTEQELAHFGQEAVPSKEGQGPLILMLMTKFAAAFVGSIDGTAGVTSLKELCGGARIFNIFNDIFNTQLESIDPVSQLTYHDVRTAIRNSAGPRASLFVPELAFDLLVKPQIKLLEQPSQRCVELVYEELMKICHNCGHAELERFPKLQARLIETISRLLNERLGPTSSYVSSLIEIQRAYINTQHSNFLSAADAMASVIENNRQRELVKAKKIASAVEQLSIQSNGTLNGNASNRGPASANGSATAFERDQDSLSADGEIDGDVDTDTNYGDSTVDSALRSAGNGNLADAAGQLDTETQSAQRDLFLSYFFGRRSPGSSTPPPPSAGPGAFAGLSTGLGSSAGTTLGPSLSSSTGSRKEISPSMTAAMQMRMERLELEAAEMSTKDRLECDLMFKLITSYFDIVRQTVSDQVPKAIMHLLVNFSKSSAQNRLVTDLYKEALFEELLYEDEAVVQERRKCEETLDTYRQAAKVITEVI